MAVPAAAMPGAGGGSSVITVDASEVIRSLDFLIGAVTGASLMHFVRGEVTEFFQQDIENRFSSEGDAKTGAWAPLKPATITIRASEGYGPGPINVRSGELKSFMSGPYPVFVDSPGSVIIDVPGDAPPGVEAKFKTAQGGSTNNPLGYGNTPARPVLADLTPAELDFIVHMFDAYVQSVMSLFS